MKFYVSFEHATGYSLFKVVAKEEIGVLIPTVQQSMNEFDRFGKVVKILGFSPFKSAAESLENGLAITEGRLHDSYAEFLLPLIKAGKKDRVGFLDSKIAAAFQERTGIKCECGETVVEIIRGIRLYYHKYIDDITLKGCELAQLGLGHSVSRSKVKFNANQSDNNILQSIALVDQLDKDINSFSMRLREWYSFHYPELYRIVNDNTVFSELVLLIGDRDQFDGDRVDEINEIVDDEEKSAEIVFSLKTSIGSDIPDLDLLHIQRFATKVKQMIGLRSHLQGYLNDRMNSIAPNLAAVVGEVIGARLISQAGGLLNLAKYPASTVQILGAEKALFRAIKTKGKTPKYGLIFNSSFISRAPLTCKGRISRLLAHKCSLASRLDCFQELPNNVIGIKLSEQLEERLEFMREPTDVLPRSNDDVMSEAVQLLKSTFEETVLKEEAIEEEEPKKRKKSRKRKSSKGLDVACDA